MSITEELNAIGQIIYGHDVLSKLEAIEAFKGKIYEIDALKREIRELKAEIRDMRLGITI